MNPPDRPQRAPELGERVRWTGLFIGVVGTMAGAAGVWILIARDGTGWHGALTSAGLCWVCGGALWICGSRLCGEGLGGGTLALVLEGGLGGLLTAAGALAAVLGALSLVAGGPPSEAVPVLGGGLAALGIGFGLSRLAG
jgi:hypothetical protein